MLCLTVSYERYEVCAKASSRVFAEIWNKEEEEDDDDDASLIISVVVAKTRLNERGEETQREREREKRKRCLVNAHSFL